MVEKIRPVETVQDEQAELSEKQERLRWINAHIREASPADLIEETAIDEDEETESADR